MNKFVVLAVFFAFGLIFLAFNVQFDSDLADKVISAPPSAPDSVFNYSFSWIITTYTPIPSGSVIAKGYEDDSTFGNIPIGFNFNYDNNNYTVVGVSDNGWVQPGAISPPVQYVYPMICSTFVRPVICPLNADLLGSAGDTIRYLTSGTAPNRVFAVEWCHFGFHPYGNNEMNFELKLFESSNKVEFAYQPISTATFASIQVGLLGQSDYASRTETSSWASTTAGTACAYCSFGGSTIPPNGLTFTFIPQPVGIEPPGYGVPNVFKLYNNFPNPFNPTTLIQFDLPKAAYVKLAIYDMLGQEITMLVNENLQAGTYSVTWNAENYPSGIYFYQLTVSSDQLTVLKETKRMVLVK